MTTYIPDAIMLSAGLLIARLVLGLALAAHGAQKLFGWFGGQGLEGTGRYFESVGFRPGRRLALIAGLSEFGGGLLTALGLFGPIGPGLMVAVMIVAMSQHIGRGFFATNNGVETPLLYFTGGLMLACTGPGAYALDAVLGLRAAREFVGIVLALALIGGLGALALRHREAPTPAAGGRQA